ncbi:MAG: galactitol-1-phosphate 5-dehydrogenase [Bryobacteraceae bacterium]
MNALLLKQYKQLDLVDMPSPTPGTGELLVRVHSCGICGSDVHGFDGSTGRRQPPLVMGHEAAGKVAGVGAGVNGFREGDRVTFDSTVYCGACFFCARGEINLCDNRQVLGVSCGDYRRHGAFAEYVVAPARIAYHLPDALRFEHAAMIEAVSVAVHAVGLTPVRLGDCALLVGAGMIGTLALQALKLAGCAQVIVADVDAGRLKMALDLGATAVINPKEGDVLEFVRERTGGRGADVAVEAVGATGPIQTAIAALRKGGALTLVGNIAPKIELPLQAVVTRQLRLFGSCASSGEYPTCIDLLARGAIRVEPLISAIAPLAGGPAWFERLYAREPGLMKVILQP